MQVVLWEEAKGQTWEGCGDAQPRAVAVFTAGEGPILPLISIGKAPLACLNVFVSCRPCTAFLLSVFLLYEVPSPSQPHVKADVNSSTLRQHHDLGTALVTS